MFIRRAIVFDIQLSEQLVRELFECRCKFLATLLMLDQQILRVPTQEESIGIGLLERDDELPNRIR